ncbi:hypothetical protein RHGRI_029309 [Rhododendron griersonianum]|uniref:Myb/SANT-like domain-containing protein n=1 Tax=Rhododendron griersonianum TaxID=479676 RepID=A0AAV6IMK5_9ERIC|nr:hypothetical protein RHGRI_029309 [Rhododendron griersonianum]
MPKGEIHQNQPSQSLDTTTTEDPCKNGVRCGKWILRSTKVRRGRGQHPSLKFELTTPLSENRKRPAPSPASSANSVIGENSIPLPTMDRTQNDLDMWSYVNTEKFIHIMVEVARKEEATNSKKSRQFNDLQWHEILRELGVRTGRIGYTIPKIREKFTRIKKEYKDFKHILDQTGFGWDEIAQIVTAPDDVWQTYLQAHPKAVKFRNQGLDHFEELDELLSSSLANGAFARPNTQPPPTRDEEVVMYGKGKPIKREDSVSMGKRKSDGSGGSTAKATKFERREEAYEKFAFSQQMKGEYYQKKAQNQTAENNLIMKECHAFLKSIKHIVGEDKYLDAYSHLVDHPRWQTSFLDLDADDRMAWVYREH